jgi:hypothetical protein
MILGSCYPDKEVAQKEETTDEIPSSWKVLFPFYPDQEVVQEEEATPGEIPSSWKVLFPFQVSSREVLADYVMPKTKERAIEELDVHTSRRRRT